MVNNIYNDTLLASSIAWKGNIDFSFRAKYCFFPEIPRNNLALLPYFYSFMCKLCFFQAVYIHFWSWHKLKWAKVPCFVVKFTEIYTRLILHIRGYTFDRLLRTHRIHRNPSKIIFIAQGNVLDFFYITLENVKKDSHRPITDIKCNHSPIFYVTLNSLKTYLNWLNGQNNGLLLLTITLLLHESSYLSSLAADG